MSTPQTGVCAEGSDFGLFITLSVNNGPEDAARVRKSIAALPKLTTQFAADLQAPLLVSSAGIGAVIWDTLCGPDRPAELVPFQALVDGHRHAPATDADVFLHIRSDRHDVNFALAREIRRRLGDAVRLVEEIHGFKYLKGRDLSGFVDGTENPQGAERAEVAVVASEDPAFSGGSYVNIQRYVHNLRHWEGLGLDEQERIIGRTKADDIELDDEIKPATAHIARVVIEDDGQELEILRHSLPYGTTDEHGLYFVSYGKSPAPFRRMLERMVMSDADGTYDHLLDFTRPVTGAMFFAPSQGFLEGLA